MLAKLIVPVIDTERGVFRYDGELSNEEYGNMEYEHFRRTDRQVGRFVDNMRRGISNVNQYQRFREVDNEEHPDFFFNNEENEVYVANVKRQSITKEELFDYAGKGKMFILILNINPLTMSGDAESEVRYWMRDSVNVINDPDLPDDVKLKSLQGRDYEIVVEDKTVQIRNCKLVQNFSNQKYPFHFAIIVEKAFIK